MYTNLNNLKILKLPVKTLVFYKLACYYVVKFRQVTRLFKPRPNFTKRLKDFTMLHINYFDTATQTIKTGYVIPLCLLNGKVNVNTLAGNDIAHYITLLAVAGRDKSATDNKLTNVLVRKAAAMMLDTLTNTGKPSDVFSLLAVREYSNRDKYLDPSLFVEVLTVTRATLRDIAEKTVAIDAIMTKAEVEANKVAESCTPKINRVNDVPDYTNGQKSTTKAKRAGGSKVISI